MSEDPEQKKKAEQLADLVVGMSYPEWSRARVAIDKEFDRKKANVRLADKEELAGAIEREITW